MRRDDRMLSLRGIAWMNLRGHPARTAALIVFTALMTLVVFGGALVVQGVRQSLETVRARLGADILVVPDDAGSEFDAQTALIQAEPGYFYMGADVLGRVAATPGVERASAQLFLASTRESCCSARLQIIAFDPATDFTVQPWIEDALGEGAIGEGDIVIGSNVTAGEGGTIRLFGNDLRVVGQFAPTGSTLDDAVYMNFDTFGAVVKSSVDKGLNKYGPAASGDVISSVSVEVGPGHDVDAVRALDQFLLEAFGHAADDAHDEPRFGPAVAFHLGQAPPDTLLGIVADRAGVDQDDIGQADILGVDVSLPLHQGNHDFRVADIHLAAVGFDEKFASGARQGAQCIRIEFKFHVPNFRYSACISFLSGNCLNPSPNVS